MSHIQLTQCAPQRVVNASCIMGRLAAAAQANQTSCFAACPDGKLDPPRPSDCWLACLGQFRAAATRFAPPSCHPELKVRPSAHTKQQGRHVQFEFRVAQSATLAAPQCTSSCRRSGRVPCFSRPWPRTHPCLRPTASREQLLAPFDGGFADPIKAGGCPQLLPFHGPARQWLSRPVGARAVDPP